MTNPKKELGFSSKAKNQFYFIKTVSNSNTGYTGYRSLLVYLLLIMKKVLIQILCNKAILGFIPGGITDMSTLQLQIK